jgi:hypothetical protein
MRLMWLAHDKHPNIGWHHVGVDSSTGRPDRGAGSDNAGPRLNDLTKPAPSEQQVTGVAGASIGGIEGQPPPSGYLLPLKVELTSIYPQPIRPGEKINVEVRLRNTEILNQSSTSLYVHIKS